MRTDSWEIDHKKLGNRKLSHDFFIHGYFTNHIVNFNLGKLCLLFSSERSFVSKEKEFVATNTDEVLIEALMCCVSLAFDLESLRNYLSHKAKEKTTTSVPNDLSRLISSHEEEQKIIAKYITEIFIVRDAIAHAHRYGIIVHYSDFTPSKTKIKSIKTKLHRQGDNKHRENVNLYSKKN